MPSFYSNDKLEQITKRIKRGQDPWDACDPGNRRECIRGAFAAYAMHRSGMKITDPSELVIAANRMFGIEFDKADRPTYFNFERQLFQYFKKELDEVRLTKRIESFFDPNFKKSFHQALIDIHEDRRKAEADRKRKLREKDKEKERERNRKAANKRRREAYKVEKSEREKFDQTHPLIVTHKVRLMPNKQQEEYIQKCFKVYRLCYNWALDTWRRRYNEGERVFADQLKTEFNAIYDLHFPIVNEVTHFAKDTGFDCFRRAQNDYFNKISRGAKAHLPRRRQECLRDGSFRFTKRGTSFPYLWDYNPDNPDSVANFEKNGPSKKRQYLHIPELGCVKMMERVRFDGRVLSAVIKQEADGHYYACINVRIDQEEWKRTHKQGSRSLKPIGIDLGVKTYAVVSNGVMIENPNIGKSMMARERLLASKMMRCQHARTEKEKAEGVRASKNFKKRAAILAKFRNKITRKREDFIHKLTSVLTARFARIVVEDFRVDHLRQKHALAAELSDIAPYRFRSLLQQKMDMVKVKNKTLQIDSQLTIANRYFPSTQICSVCGDRREERLTLKDRTFVCEHCGAVIDRDLNAARNLMKIVGPGEPDSSAESGGLLRRLKKNGIKARQMDAESK